MVIKFYGVRGSYPVPGEATAKFGGNTTCVSISKTDSHGFITRVIIDSGTGIIALGRDIITNFFEKREDMKINLFFTHLHPDHSQGFPFFGPNYFKNAQINLYGMKALGSDIEQVLSSQMTPPNFPIEYRSLKSNRTHHAVEDGDILGFPKQHETPSAGQMLTVDSKLTVKVMQAFAPSHPQQGALYYRITDTETQKSIACIWDNESKIGGDQAVINFIKGCDVVIHDTQYTKEEYESNKMIVQGFGHSTYDMAIDNVKKAGVPVLVCMHYNPSHTDLKLESIQKSFESEKDVEIKFAQEGMELEI